MVDGGRIFPNNYDVTLNLVTTSENRIHQNVALQRILFIINEIFDESIFVAASNTNVSKLAKLAKDTHIIQFPEEPFDQIVGMILFNKLSAVVEENLEIESLDIGSNLTNDLYYTVDEYQEFETPEGVEESWWDRADISTTNEPKILKKLPKWDEINLGWDRKKPDSDVEFVVELDDNGSTPEIVVLDGGTENE